MFKIGKKKTFHTCRTSYNHSQNGKSLTRRSDYVAESWVRFTVVDEGQGTPLWEYLNGVGSGSTTGETPLRNDADNGNVVLGRRYVSNGGNWTTFTIDDLIIWDEVLSDELLAMIR